ncbi:MAG: DUF4304 domain-containing protein [Desulforegulaceae bacterium]|jgi:hypothetical protein|nr:DUF4304 domain-containing protein [Desulforegulaceae bacterium]
MTISQLQKEISNSLSECCLSIGFDIDNATTFYNTKKNIIRLFHIDFLNSKNAAYFNTSTASFSLNIGIFFNFLENVTNPKEYEAHFRGQILRNFYQKHPMDLKKFSWLHPERWRRDIWWVDKDGKNLKNILLSSRRLTKDKVLNWLDKYSDIDKAIWFLKNKKENFKGGPFGFGNIKSPCRLKLIKNLEIMKR